MVVLFLILLVFLSGCSDRRVSVESLLEEMSSRESITRMPDPGYRLVQASSYNRASVSPSENGWFANADMSHFIRVEENDGRREFVMLDMEGPGAVVRWWMTFYKAQDGIIRVYIDNDSTAVVEGSPAGILAGRDLAPWPFSASVQEGAELGEEGRNYDYNLYYPIPFEKHCKITYECDSLRLLYDYEGTPVPNGYYWPDVFYNIGCRIYEKGTAVASLNEQSHLASLGQCEHTAGMLMSDVAETDNQKDFEGDIAPGDTLSIELNQGNSAVTALSLALSAGNESQALRSTVLTISFDGSTSVWVPAGEFFGTGYSLKPHRTWMNTRDDNGMMKSYWIMPFRKTCTMSFINFGDEGVSVKGSAGTKKYRWTPGSMYFGAAWHEYYNISSRDSLGSPFDLNFIEIKGTGLYAGDQVTLFNNTWYWWGEGDEKIFVDGESFPSSFGTGTEDYYGYSFGRQEAFSHPFISQPEGKGNMNYGPVVNMRHRSLDAIPFRSGIRADMELWHWANVRINYALTTYFYALPGSSHNISADHKAVKRPVIHTKEDFINLVR